MRYLKPSMLAGMFFYIFLLTTVAQAPFMWFNAHDYTPKANHKAPYPKPEEADEYSSSPPR